MPCSLEADTTATKKFILNVAVNDLLLSDGNTNSAWSSRCSLSYKGSKYVPKIRVFKEKGDLDVNAVVLDKDIPFLNINNNVSQPNPLANAHRLNPSPGGGQTKTGVEFALEFADQKSFEPCSGRLVIQCPSEHLKKEIDWVFQWLDLLKPESAP